ncbi:MAG TPA: MBL fold metallo-hydrolase [Trueperaceae bacterium]|nr:MBL fold metallo-hydrolase [Trueperaceae bacterium]
MKLISAGAAETVTGSCHLLEINGLKVLIDCGLFQGGKKTEEKNYEDFPFNVQDIDIVLITHGHLDHIGRLPILLNKGYKGDILATNSTNHIAEVILKDSAKIQQEDYKRNLRKAQRKGKEGKVREPLYTTDDIPQVLSSLKRIEFNEDIHLGNKVVAKFRPSGHILGSAFIEINSPEGKIIFSGDLGNYESSLQADARPPTEADIVVIETTYGNRNHRSMAATEAEFRELLQNAVQKQGKIMIPSFALERTQVILHQILKQQQNKQIGKLPIYLDSPMATKFTKLYQACANEFIEPIKQELERGIDPFEPDVLEYTVTTEQSKSINSAKGLTIIIAGSGMMSGGRITHHLKHNLWRKNACLIVVGYQAEGSLGRLLVDGRKKVKIHGETIAVRAEIKTIGGFSAHADKDDLLKWISTTGNAKAYLVHGEPKVMKSFKQSLNEKGRKAEIVKWGKEYQLN